MLSDDFSINYLGKTNMLAINSDANEIGFSNFSL